MRFSTDRPNRQLPCRIIAKLILVLVAAAGAESLEANELKFDDLPKSSFGDSTLYVPNGYGGLNWTNFLYLDVTTITEPSGFQNADVSPSSVAGDAFGDQAKVSGSPFTFDSAYFTGGWRDGLQVSVNGYLNGRLVDSKSFTVDTSGPTLETFDWPDVDTVTFFPFGGTPNPKFNGGIAIFAMDNFKYAPVPEPSSLALLSLGAIGLLRYRLHRVQRKLPAIIAAIALLPASLARADVFHMPTGQTSLQFVTVGDPGNLADSASHSGVGTNTSPGTGLGAVGYKYSIGVYDVTAAQYTAFLNAVARTDTYGLYSLSMSGGFASCGISRLGLSGSYSYATINDSNYPVNYVSWGSAARFCNWLQNGQPVGNEGNGTTETGAYNMQGAVDDTYLSLVASPAHTGSGAAKYFIPSENEWYKAAYYKSGGTNAGYWSYPTQSNAPPINTLPDTGNHANFFDNFQTGTGGYTDPTNYLTPVGDFNLTPGPYGTFDQGGDLFQWNETLIGGSYRGARGGSFYGYFDFHALSSSARYMDHPSPQPYGSGIRVASSVAVPEPGSLALLIAGGLIGSALIWHRRMYCRATFKPTS